jgi:putative peptidoglycan lipid II flippase
MERRQSSALKNISIVSAATGLSRLCGYLRDVVFFSCFAMSEVGAAFLLAWSLPNLFRRLLGEGALSSAIVPVFSSHCAKYGEHSMLQLFSHVAFRLLVVLVCLLGAGYGIVVSISAWGNLDKFALPLHFTILLLPYMVFVCLAATVAAALNVLGRFFISSINQVWMNVAMILSLLVGKFYLGFDGLCLANCLAIGVLCGGLVQLAVPLLALFSHGWKPKLLPNVPDLDANMATIWKLFFPGIFGASIEQINVVISRTIAYRFAASAVSSLYLASRLAELPLGLFGLAITNVFFPNMAKIAGGKGHGSVNKVFNQCLLALVWILLPSALGLFLLRKEILIVFFEHGNFTADNIRGVFPIVSVYCASMVFAGISSFLIREFHAFKDTKTPALVGLVTLLTNVTLALTLVQFFGTVGLAVGTACATILQTLCLATFLRRKVPALYVSLDMGSHAAIFYGCLCIVAASLFGKFIVKTYCHFGHRINGMVAMVLVIGLALPMYLLSSAKLIGKVFAKEKTRKM